MAWQASLPGYIGFPPSFPGSRFIHPGAKRCCDCGIRERRLPERRNPITGGDALMGNALISFDEEDSANKEAGGGGRFALNRERCIGDVLFECDFGEPVGPVQGV